MSNPTTNYTVAGVDLSNIFQPISLGMPIDFSTNFIVYGSGDLCNIFSSLNGGTPITYNTGYSVGGTDLRNIFAPFQQFTATGNPTQSNSTSYTILTYDNITGGTIKFNTINPVTVYYLIVGGGGSGGGGQIYVDLGTQYNPYILAGGSGGASGSILQSSVYINSGYECVISIGSGGTCIDNGSGIYTPNNGANSSFTDSLGNIITADGGNSGLNGNNSLNPIYNLGVLGGINASGNGGNGFYAQDITSPNNTNIPGTAAGGYDGYSHANFTIDGINMGTFGGGGGGSGVLPFYGQGNGGTGGAQNTSALNGLTGGGGGGGSYTYTNGSDVYKGLIGANGGDGVVILWFSNTIT